MFNHLKEENQSYFKHFLTAINISLLLFLASTLCLVHSVAPFLFTNSASNICKKIISEKKKKLP